MSRPDATAIAALNSEQFLRPILFLYMDIIGDQVRANNSGQPIAVNGSGKIDLDGTYDGVTADVGDVSPVSVSDGGTSSVTAKLSGMPDYDLATMNALANPANWKGRKVRMWRLIRDQTNVDRGSFQHFYTGYMVDLAFGGSPSEGQWISVTIENYLAAYSAPSNRTYMEQELFDPADLSARGLIASVIGNNSSNPLTGVPGGSGPGGGGGGGGGGIDHGGGLRNFGENAHVSYL